MICGIDEAGRGPLAGPVYASAVVFKDDFFHKDRVEPYSYDESYSQTKRVGGHTYHTFGDTVIITSPNSIPVVEETKSQKKEEDDAFARMMRRMERHLGIDRW